LVYWINKNLATLDVCLQRKKLERRILKVGAANAEKSCTVHRFKATATFSCFYRKKIGRDFSASKLERFTFFAIFSVKE
jgi:hypothetical protein